MRRTSIVAGFMLAITASAAPAPRKSSGDCEILGHNIPNCDIVAYLKSLGVVDVPLIGDMHHGHQSNTTNDGPPNSGDGMKPHDNTTHNHPPPSHGNPPPLYNTTNNPDNYNTTKRPTPHHKNDKPQKRDSPLTNLLNYYKKFINDLIQYIYLPELKSTADTFAKSPNNTTATTRINTIQSVANAIDSALMYLGLGLGGKGTSSGMSTTQKSNVNATLTTVLNELKGINGTNSTLSKTQKAQLAKLESSLQKSLGKLALEKRDGRSTWENA